MYKTKNLTDNLAYKMLSIFSVQYLNTAIILILAYNSFWFNSEDQEKSIWNIEYFRGPYDDYNVKWYLMIGS